MGGGGGGGGERGSNNQTPSFELIIHSNNKRVSGMFDKADISYTSHSLPSNNNEINVSGIQGYSKCTETD